MDLHAIAHKTMHYEAYCIADRIDLNSYKNKYPEHIMHRSSTELYYQPEPDQYLYILSYGVVVFSGVKPEYIDHVLSNLQGHLLQPRQDYISDDLQVEIDPYAKESNLRFHKLMINHFDDAINRMLMLHLAQSVALDHFNGLSQTILGEIKSYTNYMQGEGKLKLSHKQMLKFTGRTLHTKNSIAENLYILDSPEVAWEEEYLNQMHGMLVRHFELVQRYREIDNTLKIIDDNLSVYMAYNHHQESSRLEWIIIILIVIEVIDTFWSKF